MFDEKDDLDDLKLDAAIVEALNPEELAKAEKELEEFKDKLRAKRKARDRKLAEKIAQGDFSDADLEDLSEYATKEFGRLLNVWLAHKMSVGASINANIIYPRFGADGKILLDPNGKKIGDQLTLKDGKIISSHIVKPEFGTAIDRAFVKEPAKATSITFDESNPISKVISKASLNGLMDLLREYRVAFSDHRRAVHEKALGLIDKIGEGRLKVADLIADQNEEGKYSIDISKIKEPGVLKVPHLDKDGKPTGEFDIIVHDKNGKIIDGAITEGSSLNIATKNAVREAVLAREMEGVNKNNLEEVRAAEERAAVAAGLGGSNRLGTNDLSVEDRLLKDHGISRGVAPGVSLEKPRVKGRPENLSQAQEVRAVVEEREMSTALAALGGGMPGRAHSDAGRHSESDLGHSNAASTARSARDNVAEDRSHRAEQVHTESRGVTEGGGGGGSSNREAPEPAVRDEPRAARAESERPDTTPAASSIAPETPAATARARATAPETTRAAPDTSGAEPPKPETTIASVQQEAVRIVGSLPTAVRQVAAGKPASVAQEFARGGGGTKAREK
jgi:hypothetical protein